MDYSRILMSSGENKEIFLKDSFEAGKTRLNDPIITQSNNIQEKWILLWILGEF